MKHFLGVILVVGCLGAFAYLPLVHAYPGVPRDTSESDESDGEKNVDTVLMLPAGSRNRLGRPILDMSDSSDSDESYKGLLPDMYFRPSRTNPLDDFLMRMRNIRNEMYRFREQMAGILSRIPEQGASGVLARIPEVANSTTSTTKIIDGHVVTINETTYTDGDDVHGTVIRVRIIDVQPQNETILMTESEADAEVTTLPTELVTGQEESTTPSRSVETVEDVDNEIPKHQIDTLTA